MAITQEQYDELRTRLKKTQEAARRIGGERGDALKAAEKAEAARLKAEADLQRTLDENPLKAINEKLMAHIREGRHKAEFARLAKERGASDDVIDSVWKLSGYEAKGDTPDPEAIGAILDEARGKPGIAPLFAGPATTPANGQPIVKPGVTNGQGPKGSGPSPYTLNGDDDPRSNDASYQYSNFDRIAQAAQERIARGEL